MSSKKSKMKLPNFVMLVGLPGCGKSSFATQLMNSGRDWVRISQDETGSRKKCEELVGKEAKKKHKILLDRCNVEVEDRKQWLDCAFNPKKAVCVHFATDAETCIKRVNKRKDHPTIPKGKGGIIVKSFAKKLVVPTEAEGFERVYSIHNLEEMNELLTRWGATAFEPPSDYVKFPRTHHLFNANEFSGSDKSAVTRDDLLIDKKERKWWLDRELVIQEKIDGANIGFSMDNHLNVLVQNRAHYVTSTSHAQFSTIERWIETHAADLFELLSSQQYILFGEWCYAQHGIFYDSLPDAFIAFDVYDRYAEKFVSHSKFTELLRDTSIVPVPVLFRGSVADLESVYKLLDNKSEFSSENNVEGVYLRADEGNYLDRRCKVVSEEFLNNFYESWLKKKLTKNIVKYS